MSKSTARRASRPACSLESRRVLSLVTAMWTTPTTGHMLRDRLVTPCVTCPGPTLLRDLRPRRFPHPCCPLSPPWITPSRDPAGTSAPPAPRGLAAGADGLGARALAGPARAGPCWPLLPREAGDEFRPEAAGAAARRGAVAEAGAAPDAAPAVPGSAVTAPRRAARGLRNAVSRRQALSPSAPAPGSAQERPQGPWRTPRVRR